MSLTDIEKQKKGDRLLAGGVGAAALALIGLGLAYSPEPSSADRNGAARDSARVAQVGPIEGAPKDNPYGGTQETWSPVKPKPANGFRNPVSTPGDYSTEGPATAVNREPAVVPVSAPGGIVPAPEGATPAAAQPGSMQPEPATVLPGVATPATEPGAESTPGVTAPDPSAALPPVPVEEPGTMTPVEVTPVEVTPVEETPVEEAPVEETPVDAPVDAPGAPAQPDSASRTPDPMSQPQTAPEPEPSAPNSDGLGPLPPLTNPTGVAPSPGDPVAPFDNRPRVGDHPAKQFRVLTRLLTPRSVTEGNGFKATVQIHNTGDVRLRGLRVALAGRGGLEASDREPMRFDVDPIEPGATLRVERVFKASAVGQGRVVLSILDPNGWAGAGSLAVVDVTPRGAPPRGPSGKAKGVALAMSLTGKAPQRINRGKAFQMDAVLRNEGEVVLRDVQFVLSLGPNVRTVDPDAEASMKVAELKPGTSKTITLTLICDEPGLRQVRASARDAQGWAAAGIVQLIAVN